MKEIGQLWATFRA